MPETIFQHIVRRGTFTPDFFPIQIGRNQKSIPDPTRGMDFLRTLNFSLQGNFSSQNLGISHILGLKSKIKISQYRWIIGRIEFHHIRISVIKTSYIGKGKYTSPTKSLLQAQFSAYSALRIQ